MASFVTAPAKIESSVIPLVVNFISQLASGEALVGIETTAEVVSGTDASPENILSGAPSLSANVVTQQITGGVVGVIYVVGFVGTTNLNNTIIIYVYIAVVSENPFA